ncbi:MAG: BACON domain-containing protein [Draconibacterium sp.]|nr:BACON domain-containing protein [Draconibacterium sp.]
MLSVKARKKYFPNPIPDDFYTGNSDLLPAIGGDNYREDYYSWEWGDALFIVIDPFQYTMTRPYGTITGSGEDNDESVIGDQWDWTLGPQQYEWFRETLENSSAKYKFVFSHHVVGGQLTVSGAAGTPGYVRGGAVAAPYFEWGGQNANGTWGFDAERTDLRFGDDPIHQLMLDNGVNAFFHGHDHQFVHEERDGIVYQLVPSPSMTDYGFDLYDASSYVQTENSILGNLPNAGHLRVNVSSGKATVEYVRASISGDGVTNGSVSYAYDILPAISVPTLNVSPSGISLEQESGSNGTFNITSNTSWSISDDSDWLSVSPVSGSNNGTITVTANSANAGIVSRIATVTITGTGVAERIVTVTQSASPVASNTLGNTEVYSGTTTAANRRALPVTFSESGSIQSISIYHNGGTGSLLLGVYSDQSGSPASRIGVTAATIINPTAGWQTVTLTNPVGVASGQTVWLGWVFENSPGVRYATGTPGRAQTLDTWSSGMPATFGTSTISSIKFSIYCTYTAGAGLTLSVTPSGISLEQESGSNGTFNITSNTSWSISDDSDWLSVSPVSGSNNGTITVTANSANTGIVSRTATVTITGTGVAERIVTVTQSASPVASNTLGNTEVYSGTTTAANRRALPVTFSESGSIQSISIYHNGGTGSLLLGVYSDQSGSRLPE